jgi:hypothetical protein
MKKTLLLITLFLTAFIGFSQTVVFSDDFDDEDISDWTTIDADGDGNNWFAVQVTNNGNPVGTPVLRSASWSTNPLTPDNWVIAPVIDLSAYSGGTATLHWEVAAPDANWDIENYTVYASTGNTVADFMASAVTFNESTLDGVNDLTPRSLDISSLAGGMVYIAFRHHDVTDQFVIHVDNVEVVAQATASVDENSISNFVHSFINSELNIKSSENFSGISIFDITGKSILAKKLNSSDENILLNISEGIYIAKVTTENNKVKTFKFIVR